MIGLFTIINILNYLDRYLVAAVLPLLITEFGLSNEEGGHLASAFVIGYVIFAPFFGYLGDRYNRPRLMAFGVIAWSVATLLTGYSRSYYAFLGARVLVGIGEASFGTIAPGYIKDKLQDALKVNAALSIFFSAIPVGSALGYAIGGSIAKSFDWQSAFFAGGIPGLLLGLLLLRMRDEHRGGVSQPLSVKEGLLKLSRIPLLWFAIGGYVLNTFALNGVAAFVVKYGMTIGFDIDEINKYFGIILVVTGFVGTVGGGRLSTHLARNAQYPLATMLRFVGIAALLGAPFLAGAFLVESKIAFLGMCFCAELLIFAGVAPLNSIVVVSSPKEYVTLTQGLTIFCINLFGSFLAPVVVGALADHAALAMALQASSAALFASGVVWLAGTPYARSQSKDAHV